MTGWRERQETGRETIMSTAGFRTGLDWTGLEPELLTCCGSLLHFMVFISSWSSVAVGYSWKKQSVDLEFRLCCQRTAAFEPVWTQGPLTGFNSTINNSISWSSSVWFAVSLTLMKQSVDLELRLFCQRSAESTKELTKQSTVKVYLLAFISLSWSSSV